MLSSGISAAKGRSRRAEVCPNGCVEDNNDCCGRNAACIVTVVALVPVVVVVIVLGAVLDSIRQLHQVDVQNAGRTPTNR